MGPGNFVQIGKSSNYMDSNTYILKQGTSLNELEPPGTIWNYIERAGLSNELTQKNKKFIRRNCTCNTMVQQNAKLAIVTVTKSTISNVCRWNQLEQNGTNNELTQIKTLLGQYCVHNNSISLQNIT